LFIFNKFKKVGGSEVKLTISFLVCVFVFSFAFAGGLVTNTNQSAEFMRVMNRNATIFTDAVYFNPAGTAFMEDGFHFYLSNQTIFQKKTIENSYMYLNDGKYEGEVKAPIFPNVYAVMKKSKIALSLGFGPVGGGGSAEFKEGLPSFEIGFSDLVPSLNSQGVQGYRVDLYFKGSSIYYGFQSSFAYRFSEKLSIAFGGRYVKAMNRYEGYIKDVEINPGGNWMKASDFFAGVSQQYAGVAAEAYQAYQYYTAAGVEDSASYFYSLYDSYSKLGIEMTFKSNLTSDQRADVKQTGSVFIPIIGLNLAFSPDFRVSFRYEGLGKMVVKNDTKKDIIVGYDEEGNPITQFPDGEEIGSDIPSMLSFGLFYQVAPRIRVLSDLNYFSNKSIDWDGKEKFVNSEFEAGLGVEYILSPKVLVSCGYLFSKTGATDDYQSDMSYGLDSQSLGFGGSFELFPGLTASVGISKTFYKEDSRSFSHVLGNKPIPVTEKYDKDTFVIAFGLNYSIGR